MPKCTNCEEVFIANQCPKCKTINSTGACQLEQRVRRLFYFGTYGLMVDPIEMELDKADWLDKKLKEHIKEHLVVGWAISRMKILADMLDDRKQTYFADEMRKIMGELEKQSA